MDIRLPIQPRPSGARKKGIGSQAHVKREPITHGYFKSFDGTKLFYSVEGQGKPLVFCYGLVCSSLHWTYQIDYFQTGYQTIWFDYRGHHNSETPKDLSSLTIGNIAHDLQLLLDELKIDKPVLLGHSMGVNVVLDFYRMHPERVHGMVLANGTAQRPLETLFRNNALQTAFELLKKAHQKSPDLVSNFLKLQKGNPLARTLIGIGGFNPNLTPKEDIELYVSQVLEMDPSILIHLIQNYNSYDATSWLHTIQAPTLIIAGQQDRVVPVEQQELMKQLISGSQLEIIHHGSHCPQMDLPDLVNVKIERFLKEISYGSRSIPTTGSANQSNATDPSPAL